MPEVDPRLQVFVDLFNICYPDWKVGVSTERDLEPEHVDFDASLQSYWGRCGPRSGGRVFYRVNPDWWADHPTEDRVGLIIHELSHVQDTSHSPAFWEQVVENYEALHARQSEVEDVVCGRVDWPQVEEFIVTDPQNETVDNRRETAYERRLSLADALNYDGNVEPFDGMSFYTRSYAFKDSHERVDVAVLEHEEYSVDELVDFMHSRPREGVQMENGSYVIEPPVGRHIGGGRYEVVEGHERAALARRAVIEPSRTRNKLSVKVFEK